jgi:hypothetical protein
MLFQSTVASSTMTNETPAPDVTRLPIRRNVSFVAATTELTERTHSWERGRLLGFNDLLSGGTGAALTLLGGLALTAAGVAAVAIGAMALVAAPALWILRAAIARRPPVHDYLRRTPCPR